MKFGVFDHLDRNQLSLADFYAQRLALCELYDAGGFYGYHIAEHHSTPLGLASSPSVFLSAVAQRTRRLRFGPLVYSLPLHHPLGLIEEVCMLDQMSGGRFELGVGKGISPIETGYFGVDPEKRQKLYFEALDILLRGLDAEALPGRKLSFEGEYYRYRDVPMELAPVQKPHPPIWVGVATADGADHAGRRGYNFVSLSTVTETRALTERYRAAAREARVAAQCMLGLGRFVIVATTDDEALAIARRTYPKWHANFHYLYSLHGRAPVFGARAPDFDLIRDGGRGIAGSPATVAGMLRSQLAGAGVNYFVGQFAFGDLTTDEITRSVDLFVQEVMPGVQGA
jgi:alkanesulfonate monooxygenase SsuD/methylene tetrahydromethanopterin reductase-like flavin-dependent oxidoreductase (luciferase family)